MPFLSCSNTSKNVSQSAALAVALSNACTAACMFMLPLVHSYSCFLCCDGLVDSHSRPTLGGAQQTESCFVSSLATVNDSYKANTPCKVAAVDNISQHCVSISQNEQHCASPLRQLHLYDSFADCRYCTPSECHIEDSKLQARPPSIGWNSGHVPQTVTF